MKIFGRSISGASVALLVIQLALVSTVAAKYAYERWICPRVWTQAGGYDPQLPLRGRYLSLRLQVDGCASTLPTAAQAQFPRDYSGAVKPGPYFIRPFPSVQFRADLKVEHNRLEAVRIPNEEGQRDGQMVDAWPQQSCSEMTLNDPVYFYVPDNAPSLMPLKPGQELWIESTIPPKGPPRPTQLALKENGVWKPLKF
jgi:hypothetical protein